MRFKEKNWVTHRIKVICLVTRFSFTKFNFHCMTYFEMALIIEIIEVNLWKILFPYKKRQFFFLLFFGAVKFNENFLSFWKFNKSNVGCSFLILRAIQIVGYKKNICEQFTNIFEQMPSRHYLLRHFLIYFFNRN